MRLVQISDFHFTQLTWSPLKLLSKRILGNLNWVFFRKAKFSEKQLESLPKLFEELAVDLILLGGDLSTTSLKEEFKKASKLIGQFTKPWVALPGNHDHYTYKSYREKRFYNYFANQKKPISHPVQFFTLKEHGIEAHKMQNGWWTLALDTVVATNLYSSEGLFSEKLESYLKEVLSLIPSTEQILLLTHYPFFQNDVKRHNLKRGEALQKILKQEPRIRLYLHGHTHRQIVADLQVNQLPLILDSGSCSDAKNGSWNLIDLTQKGCSVSTFRFENKWINTKKQEFLWTR
jgi:3',5'-cyclic AMP phosphodiesterase CpdA